MGAHHGQTAQERARRLASHISLATSRALDLRDPVALRDDEPGGPGVRLTAGPDRNPFHVIITETGELLRLVVTTASHRGPTQLRHGLHPHRLDLALRYAYQQADATTRNRASAPHQSAWRDR